ncbi:Mrp complex subunit E, sodium/proton antiporter subunit [Alkalihalophilus pseudofirmus OF4]|uniref:Na(+)/H(+) antiporter subunit E n=1 Tax=Alkalihalophilus pseudofirmus (strain ATCC BAA-2126 / JCM 17055 / OF4) TaxID=398511 RepID=MRPE_ALKPO|nr:Na+/H+ antiporter subunit E [Alkalihalophilus pseudofirmus]Q9RGZ1.1 RecName: Full=Na(+)/H(+) antiporter subunit E; AltName: Full=Mrp complex subunit E; AltName: Full=Multiple resistance and pH homeostasis protein E [Alkalihalophilus pseudofirmus OF4]AAF21816.1 multiple resistance and pH regulation related protein E [Cytobacillus firmus]ABS70477.1 MrpE [synthetic construct]ADC50689.1 Mrp complex subunit E, sodium/proton antiporter subunit [Alkalihalophilus pseudofirmus OF4]
MAFQILLNLVIAVIWVNFQNSYTAVDFLIGYVVGIFILFVLRRFLRFDFYMRRIWAIIKLISLFFKELILANIDVIKIVLSPKMNIQPGIVAVPTKLKTDWELSLLASLISLTPGTLSMDFSDDNKYIYIHAIDVPNKEKMIRDIHDTFERAILEVTK